MLLVLHMHLIANLATPLLHGLVNSLQHHYFDELMLHKV